MSVESFSMNEFQEVLQYSPTEVGGDGHINSYRLDLYPLESTNTPSTARAIINISKI